MNISNCTLQFSATSIVFQVFSIGDGLHEFLCQYTWSFHTISHHSPDSKRKIFFSITSFCGHLPRYHWRMVSIVSQTDVVLVNRRLSNESFNWAHVSMRNYP